MAVGERDARLAQLHRIGQHAHGGDGARPRAVRADRWATTRCWCACRRQRTSSCACVISPWRCSCRPSGLTRRLDGLVTQRSRRTGCQPLRPAGDVCSAHARVARSRTKPHPIMSPACASGSSRGSVVNRSADLGEIFETVRANVATCPHDRTAQRLSAYVANVGIKDDTDDFVVVAADVSVPRPASSPPAASPGPVWSSA